MSQPYSHVATTIQSVERTGAYKGTKYISPKHVIKVTRRTRIDRRGKQMEFVVTIGRPNYAERKFIAKHHPSWFPMEKVQLKFKKRAA